MNKRVDDRVNKEMIVRDGSTIHYQIRGYGEAVMFLHGNSQSHRYFMKQKTTFSQRFKTIWLDTRDHGCSTNTQNTLTFEMIVEDIYELIQKEQLLKVSLVGFSDGANIALLFAKYYPDYLDKLVLVSPNVSLEGLKPSQQVKTRLYLKFVTFFNFSAAKRRAQLALAETGISREELQQLTAPVLLIQGVWDIIEPQHINNISEQLPNVTVERVKGVGHSVPFLRPRWFNDHVLAFLSK
ncbi:alpha/beta fold hydrolase [Vagococcus xieshaowenii]|uniref:Alpha/beta hydrolase n=1 Tax=Vagococcus xieshaowenii TaxID=2562451 RepID=A0AAJ5EG50_9ENTE|nr:alpha/beta hydrolase [Vagococcus xieshaowenii]QCA29526.1 alpha/beta hydrolase [Vagococcus xieshaowenii]TFZ42642.1 alpha/beta hydrolase [Vagococcus xieshaowenii]